MKPIRSLMLGVAVALIAFFGIALVLPSEYTVRREMDMKAGAPIIFQQVNMLRNWEKWAFTDFKADSIFSYAGEPSGEGALIQWKTDKADGRLEIVNTVADSLVALRMLTDQGAFESKITFSIMRLDSASAKVVCEERGSVGMHLTARYFVALGGLQKSMGKRYDTALEALKLRCEDAQEAKKYRCH